MNSNMKDIDYANEDYLASQREDFEQSIAEADWDTARAILGDLEEKGIDTYVLRRDMNIAMAEVAELEAVYDEKWSSLQRSNGY